MNACQSCGACCALFKVALANDEADDTQTGIVPVDFTVKISETRRAMKGTEAKRPRCMALQGKIGYHVYCSIYDRRPQTCRAFTKTGEKGVENWLCDKARLSYGISAISLF